MPDSDRSILISTCAIFIAIHAIMIISLAREFQAIGRPAAAPLPTFLTASSSHPDWKPAAAEPPICFRRDLDRVLAACRDYPEARIHWKSTRGISRSAQIEP